jgi:preprotein translocase subunit YajC
MDILFLQAGIGSGMSQFIIFPVILGVMYFFMIRPQANRQKEQEAFTNALEKGQDVVTSSGIIGKINKIEGNIITLQVANNVFLRFTKSAISKEMTDAMATTLKDEAA